MSLRLLLCLALVLAGHGAGRVAGDGPPPAPVAPTTTPTERLETWIAAIDAHKAGELDDPARRIAAWRRPVLDELFRYQKALVTLMTRPSDAERAALVRKLGKKDVDRLVRL